MTIDKITKIEAACSNCDTKIIINDSYFREVCNNGLTCSVCKEDIQNIKSVISNVHRYNQAVDTLEKELDSCKDIYIY
ncbi:MULTISPECIES: hypothetical protein [unclassified Clostridioides]|uniref:hypothetical protein n=1 Tax=unclassified Clostridioides TaxID=2635829 RepID=UPI001D0C909B|nr:hypothetical protein [Clostridioides sp. ES-S-0049-03]MCC0652664.1 hypothetical protein [Clostridioides sp. ES-S-0001-03]MCC0677935.1 hypothetical protein [Clostridioides sp. ES-W-0018-02]MCC0712700.1 hypothetical protein [Clostridioides sp. ES-W-0017-02]